MKESPVKSDAKVGLIIGTRGSAPYIHCHLECLKRHEPNVKVMIHDDASPQEGRLRELAADYGAAFYTTGADRLQPTVGDLNTFVEGLRWGDREGLDIVVKCSRSLIIEKPWSVALAEGMAASHYVTACAYDSWHQFGFTSEIVSMHVQSWIKSGAMAMMAETVRENKQFAGLPEGWIHERSREVHRFVHPIDNPWANVHDPNCDMLVRTEQVFGRPGNWDSYYPWWHVCGLSRHSRAEKVYWHDQNTDDQYAALAQSLGLDYQPSDFTRTPGE